MVYGAELSDDWYDGSHWPETFSHKLSEKLGFGLDYTCLAKCGNSNDKIFRDLIRWFVEGKISDTCNNQTVGVSDCTHMVVLWSQWFRDEIFSFTHDYNFPNGDISQSWDDVNMGLVQYRSCGNNISNHITENQLKAVTDHWNFVKKDGRKRLVDVMSFMQTIQLLCDTHGIKLIQGFFSTNFYDQLVKLRNEDSNTLRSRTRNNYWQNINKMVASLKPTSKVGFGKFKSIVPYFVKDKELLPFGHPTAEVHAEYAEYLYNIFQEHFPEGEK